MKNDIKVGLFVATGLVILMTSIVMIGGRGSILKSYYTLWVPLTQVQGLAEGSVVSFAGISIGNVGKIRLNEKDQSLTVALSIDRDYQSRITRDAQAGVRTQGALGDKYVYITPGSLSEPPLQDGDMIRAETSPDLIDMLAQKGPELVNIVEVIKEAHILLKNVNADNRSGQLMQNLVAGSQQMKDFFQQAQGLIKDLRGNNDKGDLPQSFARLNSVLTKIDKGEGTLGALVNDSSIHDRLSTLLGDSPRNKYLKPLIRGTIQKQESKN